MYEPGQDRKITEPKLLVFDLDGVLRFTSALHEAAIRASCQELSMSQSWEYPDIAGLSTSELFDELVSIEDPIASKRNKKRFIDLKRAFSRANLASCELNWDLVEALEALSLEYTLGIFTGASRESAQHFIHQIGERASYFEFIWGSGWGLGTKLNAESFIEISRITGIPPGRVWMFDDSVRVLSAAREAGMYACHVFGDVASNCRLEPGCSDSCVKTLTNQTVRGALELHA